MVIQISLEVECSEDEALEFVKNAIEDAVELTRSLAPNHPMAKVDVTKIEYNRT